MITADQLATPVSYEGFEAIGSGLGSAGFIVYDDSTCMVEVAAMLSRFLSVESCGQCPPCKLGTGAITEALDRIVAGSGTDRDLPSSASGCASSPTATAASCRSRSNGWSPACCATFPDDFADHLETGRCPRPRQLPIPKIVDIADGVVTYDLRQARKRPDWTYDDG